ncbi:C45 family autoproteolytic acyltransferase/hydolase [Rhizobium mesoamericanum]|uniref:Peptidase C45 acyl-coenzyme A:6-aminopenicillanic acid acyl-transferase n=1 Tax=Rhizobium mesoamericanum STM3625 TaxID=1211777 RepID=K0PZA7_9HYPH|nr:C45 family peptidase [Rhizobium mesoamericanum]CCM76822.1 Peptidase C45 acyl-coenzyme A:6-aminopenicillanic acid acyl-transferase [Rhizobium mesoamericanum STM3625]
MSIDKSHRLSRVEIAGEPFEIGLQLGRHGADTVHSHLIHTYAWAHVTESRNHDRVQAARRLTETLFPRYLEELRGLAAGLELPLEDVFAWNCRGDIRATSPDGCTTVQIPGSEPVVAHNEDGDPGLRRGCALATVRPSKGRAYTAFIYPASLPGHTFAVNDAGLVMTVNNIRSRETGTGLPRMIVTRALLDCGSLDEAVERVKTAPRAGAFHLTLARSGEAAILSLEFTHKHLSVHTVQSPSSHANHLIHEGIRAEQQLITSSSNARQERADAMIAEADGSVDPLAILRDRAQKALPIYRQQPDDPDNENTLATACFKICTDKVDCTIYDGSETSPRFRFKSDALDPA